MKHLQQHGYILQKAKSIEEIVKCYSELVYIQEKQIIVCEYCVDRAKINKLNETEKNIGFIRASGIEEHIDVHNRQPRKFLNLKKTLKYHIESLKFLISNLI